ncbi:hypothetical protein C8F01DRAFT_1090481 [Mycena amicta]|nr:hypothetical protein C8F01DRAFT_1090481 [Mycena amicta]
MFLEGSDTESILDRDNTYFTAIRQSSAFFNPWSTGPPLVFAEVAPIENLAGRRALSIYRASPPPGYRPDPHHPTVPASPDADHDAYAEAMDNYSDDEPVLKNIDEMGSGGSNREFTTVFYDRENGWLLEVGNYEFPLGIVSPQLFGVPGPAMFFFEWLGNHGWRSARPTAWMYQTHELGHGQGVGRIPPTPTRDELAPIFPTPSVQRVARYNLGLRRLPPPREQDQDRKQTYQGLRPYTEAVLSIGVPMVIWIDDVFPGKSAREVWNSDVLDAMCSMGISLNRITRMGTGTFFQYLAATDSNQAWRIIGPNCVLRWRNTRFCTPEEFEERTLFADDHWDRDQDAVAMDLEELHRPVPSHNILDWGVSWGMTLEEAARNGVVVPATPDNRPRRGGKHIPEMAPALNHLGRVIPRLTGLLNGARSSIEAMNKDCQDPLHQHTCALGNVLDSDGQLSPARHLPIGSVIEGPVREAGPRHDELIQIAPGLRQQGIVSSRSRGRRSPAPTPFPTLIQHPVSMTPPTAPATKSSLQLIPPSSINPVESSPQTPELPNAQPIHTPSTQPSRTRPEDHPLFQEFLQIEKDKLRCKREKQRLAATVPVQLDQPSPGLLSQLSGFSAGERTLLERLEDTPMDDNEPALFSSPIPGDDIVNASDSDPEPVPHQVKAKKNVRCEARDAARAQVLIDEEEEAGPTSYASMSTSVTTSSFGGIQSTGAVGSTYTSAFSFTPTPGLFRGMTAPVLLPPPSTLNMASTLAGPSRGVDEVFGEVRRRATRRRRKCSLGSDEVSLGSSGTD